MSFTGIAYLCDGFELIFRKGIKRFCFVPILINILLYLLLGNIAIRAFSNLMGFASAGLPDWLGFLIVLAWLLFGVLALIIVGYSFTIVAMIIGSPFHGLLAEKVASELGYRNFEHAWSAKEILTMTTHALLREGKKLLYILPRAIGIFILTLILSPVPILNIFVPAITFLWAAWSMSVQFVDYPADNDGVAIPDMLTTMREKRTDCFWLGGGTVFLLSIPVLNIFVIPLAVAAATKFWLIELAPDTGT